MTRSTTESVAVHTEITGAFDRGRWSATIDRTTDLVVSGLAGANTTKIWNGVRLGYREPGAGGGQHRNA